MTAHPDQTPPPASTFIDRIERGLDDATKAVLDIAFVSPELTGPAFDRILATFAPEHAAVIRQIAADLLWAIDLRSDEPSAVLRRFYGLGSSAFTWIYPDRHCDQLAEEKETDAVRAAQLVASLLARRVDVVEQVAGQVKT